MFVSNVNLENITEYRYNPDKGDLIMDLNSLLEEKQISKYRLNKLSGVPYSTIEDICNGKTDLKKCSAETVYRIAKALDVSMEDILWEVMLERPSFDLYKSNVCHDLKVLGDEEFIAETLQRNDIRTFYERRWYRESLYLLAMLDYISRVNDIPICSDYDDIREFKLAEPVYPLSVIATSVAANNDDAKREAFEASIPEFKRFNIVESEVRNVI